MPVLNTRQRDLLQFLLKTETPVGATELAVHLELTPRQVNYGLQGLKQWLADHEIELKLIPGVGAQLNCNPEQYRALAGELAAEARYQLVLTGEQRQQLLALYLLASDEQVILYQLQGLTQTSRTTIMKDLDLITAWLKPLGLILERRPNYGISVAGDETARRHALITLLWGETPLGDGLFEMSHSRGILFPLGKDAALLPIVKQTNELIKRWDIRQCFGQVAYAEAQLGGRFTDNAVLHLALVLAVHSERIKKSRYLTALGEEVGWLQTLRVWAVAGEIGRHLSWKRHLRWPETEVASLARYILAAPRNERWPDDLAFDPAFADLIDQLMARIANAYQLPDLVMDRTLRDGIIIHVVPACLRERFQLWLPSSSTNSTLSSLYALENSLARDLVTLIEEATQVALPASDVSTIALLLRAAFIRERPIRDHRVLVVCPSGMATAQLLVARLKARFPRLTNLTVQSVREFSKSKRHHADLIITTVPLAADVGGSAEVIQVHPLLAPTDIETITHWLAEASRQTG